MKINHHADAIFEYADLLAEEGHTKEAIKYYLTGLHYETLNADAHYKLSKLFEEIGEHRGARGHKKEGDRIKDNKKQRERILKLTTNVSSLPFFNESHLNSYSIVIVEAGEIDWGLADNAGKIVSEVLKTTVYRYPEKLTLPPHDRKRGVLGHPQWKISTLYNKFIKKVGHIKAPIQFVILTSSDLYSDNSNYVFATSFREYHYCVISYARFASKDSIKLCESLAGQTLKFNHKLNK